MEPGIKNGDCNSDIPGRCDVNNFDTLNSVYIKVENDDESELNVRNFDHFNKHIYIYI